MLIIPPQLLCLLCNKHDDICYSNTKIEPNALIKKRLKPCLNKVTQMARYWETFLCPLWLPVSTLQMLPFRICVQEFSGHSWIFYKNLYSPPPPFDISLHSFLDTLCPLSLEALSVRCPIYVWGGVGCNWLLTANLQALMGSLWSGKNIMLN